MHVDSDDPKYTPTEQVRDDKQDVVPTEKESDDTQDVVPGPVPAPVPITIGGHHQGIRENIQDGITFIRLWLLSGAELVLKTLKSRLLALAFTACILTLLVSNIMPSSVVSEGLSLLCTIPSLSTVSMCIPISNAAAPFPKLVEQQIRFASVTDSASLNSNLALDLMHTEMAVKDLNAEIKLSKVESKDALIRALDNIADLANEANQQLITLQSGVGNAVDSISAMNEWGIDALQAVEVHNERSFISDVIFPFRPPPIGRDEIIETFEAIAGLMESKLHNLIDMAQLTVTTLSTLKGEFGTVQEIQLRAVQTTQLQRDQGFAPVLKLLAKMWTLSEENREKLGISTKNMDLLSEVEKYRSTAALKVGDTLMQLVELRADLVNLRSDVKSRSSRQKAKPQLEILMMTLRNGAQRLGEARAMARSKDARSRKRMFYGAQVPELA